MVKKRAVILTGKAGNGHLSVADAYRYWLLKWGYQAEVYDVLPQPSDQVTKLLYKVPATYRSLYRLSDKPTLSQAMVEILAPEIERKIGQLVPDYDSADIVISTHLFVHPEGKNFKVMIILDPIVHAVYFVRPRPDYYFAFWGATLFGVKKNDLNPDKIIYTGPLARPSFYEVAKHLPNERAKRQFKKSQGIPEDHLLVLVMAGSAWIFRSARYLDSLKQAFEDEKVTFVFLCGRSKGFVEEMTEEYRGVKMFKFLRWLEEGKVAQWMAMADCGLAFSLAQMSVEAGLTKLPLFIFRLIEGQEEGYREVVNGKGVGLYLPGQPADQVELFKNLLPKREVLFKKNLEAWQKELLASPEKTRATLDRILSKK